MRVSAAPLVHLVPVPDIVYAVGSAFTAAAFEALEVDHTPALLRALK